MFISIPLLTRTVFLVPLGTEVEYIIPQLETQRRIKKKSNIYLDVFIAGESQNEFVLYCWKETSTVYHMILVHERRHIFKIFLVLKQRKWSITYNCFNLTSISDVMKILWTSHMVDLVIIKLTTENQRISHDTGIINRRSPG